MAALIRCFVSIRVTPVGRQICMRLLSLMITGKSPTTKIFLIRGEWANLKVQIWADGGCRGNGQVDNVGGWGAVLKYDDAVKEIKGGDKNTTNNVMELSSVINALRSLKRFDLPIEVTMDSQYVVKGVNEWSPGWIKKNWKGVKNPVLWKQLLNLIRKFGDIKFIQCAGHADNAGNNRADALANMAMDEQKQTSDACL